MTLETRDSFYALADELLGRRREGEEMRLSFQGEESDFVRFNNAAIRQPGSVRQLHLSMELIRGKRHCRAHVVLSGDRALDGSRLRDVLERLRVDLGSLPEDPYLILPDDPRSTEQVGEDRLPKAEEAVEEILDAASGTDFVGIFASGGLFKGFASSLGQKSWFSSHPFNLDFSIYAHEDKALKESLAGLEWNGATLRERLGWAREKLPILDRPPKDISPGGYRVFLAPAAMEEILNVLSYNGFGLRSHRSKTTSLLRLLENEAALSPEVTLTESTKRGLGPSFDDSGFVCPDEVRLIEGGKLTGALVSPRSAVEYDVPTNAASSGEHPRSLEMAPGDIAKDDVLEKLGEGILIGNLWYLNYSDLKNCRMTGMTRFGTFWVEGGQIVAPAPAMRFDESVYRMLGDNLEGLTREQELIMDPSTYSARSTNSARVPGAIVRDFTLTL